MQHGAHRGQAAVGDPAAEIVLVHVLGYLAIDQVDELVAFGQIVHRDDVLDAAAVQPAHQIAANEACGSGYDDH
ncbi:hypothetical protein G6F63_016700 [Rhizopus arrhizus]|nr:hypothetical protein G6F63_016700 [Rhizopus arrhizus]